MTGNGPFPATGGIPDGANTDSRRTESPDGTEHAPPARKVVCRPRARRRGGRVPDPDAEPAFRLSPGVGVRPLLVDQIEREPSDTMRPGRVEEGDIGRHARHSAPTIRSKSSASACRGFHPRRWRARGRERPPAARLQRCWFEHPPGGIEAEEDRDDHWHAPEDARPHGDPERLGGDELLGVHGGGQDRVVRALELVFGTEVAAPLGLQPHLPPLPLTGALAHQ
jgi:hypothetical protein